MNLQANISRAASLVRPLSILEVTLLTTPPASKIRSNCLRATSHWGENGFARTALDSSSSTSWLSLNGIVEKYIIDAKSTTSALSPDVMSKQ